MTQRHTLGRWPIAECLHEDTEITEIRNGFNVLLRTRERCCDCRATHTPEGWV